MTTLRFYIATLIVAGALSTQAEMHTFNLPDGREIEAEIMGYNGKLGHVELKRADGKRVKVEPTLFVDADQKYIQEWASLDGFRNTRLFKISCKRNLVEKWKEAEEGMVTYSDGSRERETVSETKFERHVYELILENRTGIPLEGLTAEYRIFYEQDSLQTKGSKVKTEEKRISGSLDISRLDAAEKKMLTTKPVVIHDKEYTGDITYGERLREKERGEVKGLWLRITASTSGGQTAVREIYDPSGVEGKYSW